MERLREMDGEVDRWRGTAMDDSWMERCSIWMDGWREKGREREVGEVEGLRGQMDG